MMKTITLTATLFFAAYSFVSLAEIYKTTNKEGNVVYTDNPSPSRPSEQVKLKPITPLPPAEHFSSPPPRSDNSTGRFRYEALAITSPVNDSTVRNNGNFLVNVSLQPALQGSHKLRLLVNGKLLAGPQTNRTFTIENMFRGTHQLQVEIVDAGGKTLKQASSTIHVQRPIVKPETKEIPDSGKVDLKGKPDSQDSQAG